MGCNNSACKDRFCFLHEVTFSIGSDSGGREGATKDDLQHVWVHLYRTGSHFPTRFTPLRIYSIIRACWQTGNKILLFTTESPRVKVFHARLRGYTCIRAWVEVSPITFFSIYQLNRGCIIIYFTQI